MAESPPENTPSNPQEPNPNTPEKPKELGDKQENKNELQKRAQAYNEELQRRVGEIFKACQLISGMSREELTESVIATCLDCGAESDAINLFISQVELAYATMIELKFVLEGKMLPVATKRRENGKTVHVLSMAFDDDVRAEVEQMLVNHFFSEAHLQSLLMDADGNDILANLEEPDDEELKKLRDAKKEEQKKSEDPKGTKDPGQPENPEKPSPPSDDLV